MTPSEPMVRPTRTNGWTLMRGTRKATCLDCGHRTLTKPIDGMIPLLALRNTVL